MLLSISALAGDDRTLLDAIAGMVAGLVEVQRPEVVHLVRVRGAFDHKWLRYSGRGRVAFHGVKTHTSLDPFWQDKLTFPPFAPSRVVSETSFDRKVASRYERTAEERLVHDAHGHSAANLQRRVTQQYPSSLFVWLSTDAQPHSLASLMVYEVFPKRERTWFASLLLGPGGWTFGKTKGIDRETLLARLPTLSAEGCAGWPG